MQKLIIIFFGTLLLNSCIDRINIVVPDTDTSELVVDGVITNESGPYTIQLSRATKIEKSLVLDRKVVTNAIVSISDDIGTTEILSEKQPGIYQTKVGGIQGVIGRSYSIKIETTEGKVYESIPDRMTPVGELDSLYYEFESYIPLNDQERYGFRFFINANSAADTVNLVRWKFTAIFEVDADPRLHVLDAKSCRLDPRPCSGFVYVLFDGGYVKKVGDCTCCTCWVTRYEKKPHISDNQFVTDGKSKKIEVGFIPLEYFPFLKGKYRAEVKQMSLSKQAFSYWQLILSQKEGAASLFQPPTGKIRTNVFEKNGEDHVLGVFYASAVKTKQLYLGHSDVKTKFSRVPFWDCEVGKIAESCILAFENSSNVPPADWK